MTYMMLSTRTVGVRRHRFYLSPCELLLTHPLIKKEALAAHQATTGTPRWKWRVKIFDQLSSPGEVATSNSIGSSGISSMRGTLAARSEARIACVERSLGLMP